MPNISETHAQQLRDARNIYSEKDRKRRKAAIFTEVKRAAGLSSDTRIKVEIDAKDAPFYCALKNADTNEMIAPVMAPYYSVVKKTALAAPPIYAANPQHDPKDRAVAKSPLLGAPYGVAKVAAADHRAPMSSGAPTAERVTLKLGSLSLEDALSLLRVDADTRDTYASAEGEATSEVFIKNNRLYFVL